MRLIISVDEKTINQCTESVRSGINTYEQYIIACGVPYTEVRPQGEWIDGEEETGALGIVYKYKKCSKCSWESNLLIPREFCPKCGAYMRGGRG